jgi:hypothetical protein
MGRAWFTGYYRQMELMAGKELESEADRFKYLFAGGENIGCEQFLGLLNSKALCHVVPVRMRVPLIVYSVHSFAPPQSKPKTLNPKQEAVSRPEAEQIYHQFAPSPISDDDDKVHEDVGSSRPRLTLKLFTGALDQVGRLCAQKLILMAQAPPNHQSLSQTEAAIYQKLQSTNWLVTRDD